MSRLAGFPRLAIEVAFLTLPGTTALPLAGSTGWIMVLSAAIAATQMVLGLGPAFETKSPAGAVIVRCGATVYILALATKSPRQRLAKSSTSQQQLSPP